ncbi:MAG: hypothetical protein NZM26_00890 [Patescibacteria group bacterium]|nr:hypothetical protein [Patescibacteria group bacterium]
MEWFCQELYEGAHAVFPENFDPKAEAGRVNFFRQIQEDERAFFNDNREAFLESIRRKSAESFRRIGGFIPGKHVAMRGPVDIYAVDQNGMTQKSVEISYPEFSVISRINLQEAYPDKPLARMLFAPDRRRLLQTPFFSIFYYLDQNKRLVAKIYCESPQVLFHDVPDYLMKDVALVLSSCLGNWLSVCEGFAERISYPDPEGEHHLALTPIVSGLYSTFVSEKLISYIELVQPYLNEQAETINIKEALAVYSVPHLKKTDKNIYVYVNVSYTGQVLKYDIPGAFQRLAS